MANPTTVGHIITVDGVTIVNHTTLRAKSIVQNAATSNILTYVIPTGVKVDYNSTTDGTTTPGTMSQEIICTSGGAALYGTLVAKLSHYVTTVFSPLTGADRTNTATRLGSVEDITPGNVHGTAYMEIRVTVEIVGDWT